MARVLTGDNMVDSVRKRTMAPDDTSIFTDSDILDIIDEEMNAQVLDKLVTLHGENLTYSIDIPRNDSGSYDIPYRALGNKLRDVSLVNGSTVFELAQIGIGELPDYSYGSSSNSYLDKFYVQNNKINLIQESRQYTSIRMKYYLRPNFLTKTEEAGVIASAPVVDDTLGTVTFSLSSVGKNFNSTTMYDIVGFRSPNKIKAFDLVPVSYTKNGDTGIIVFNKAAIADILDDIIVGDFISLEQQTPVPNIPTEMHPLLAQAAAVHILEALGDTEALGNADKRMGKMTKAIQELIDDRVELAPKKIKPRHGTLSQSIRSSRNSKGGY